MYKNEIDTKCLLCAKEEENIEHFILSCKSLSKVRNTMLQEIITAFNKLGIEFDELSANEKLQHILDVTPVVKTKKLFPASVVEIERLT
jgi:arginyl-tRNA synthetase